MPNWSITPALVSKHITNCGRCTLTVAEAASVEVFAINGEGYFSLCHKCFGDFVLFISNQEVTMNPVFDIFAIDEDIDIAMHHYACSCIECTLFVDDYEPDADEVVKSWKEDAYIFEHRERLTA